MRLGVAGFVKYLRKSPPDDADITESLVWVRDMTDRVLTESGPDDAEMDQLDFRDELVAQEVEDQLMMRLDASEIVETTA